MSLILTLVIGGVVGWLASLIMKTGKQMGLLANVIVGVVGSALGSWLFGVLGFAAYGALAHWLVAIAGAVVLIALLKALKIYR